MPNVCNFCTISFRARKPSVFSQIQRVRLWQTCRVCRLPRPRMASALSSLKRELKADLETTFASLQSRGVDALLITTNPFYEGRREQIVALAKRYSVPVVYPWREYAAV